MGFLGFGNYDKPGPGVNKDEPPKAAPVRFFEVLGRKFWKLVQVNLMFMIPLVIVLLLSFLIHIFPQHYMAQFQIGNMLLEIDIWDWCVASLPFILLSPFYGGMTYISRNFAREEHAFVWHDFWKTVKQNWKAFILNGIISYLVFVIMSFSILFYFSSVNKSGFYYIPLALCIIFAILFIFAQYYIPVMIITFDLKLRQIYKNAFIFAMAGSLRNLLLTVFFGGMGFLFVKVGLSTVLALLISLVLVILIFFAFSNYLVNFVIYSLIDRFLIQPANKTEDIENAEIDERTEAEKKLDEELEMMNEQLEEESRDNDEDYVYVNGRLMKKSDLDKLSGK